MSDDKREVMCGMAFGEICGMDASHCDNVYDTSCEHYTEEPVTATSMAEDDKPLCNMPKHTRMKILRVDKGSKKEITYRYEIPVKGKVIARIKEVIEKDDDEGCVEQDSVNRAILDAEQAINSNPKFAHIRMHLFHDDEVPPKTITELLAEETCRELTPDEKERVNKYRESRESIRYCPPAGEKKCVDDAIGLVVDVIEDDIPTD